MCAIAGVAAQCKIVLFVVTKVVLRGATDRLLLGAMSKSTGRGTPTQTIKIGFMNMLLLLLGLWARGCHADLLFIM